MKIDPEEFKRRYSELSDEGLLSIEREDLTEFARMYYDAEVVHRGLTREEPQPLEQAEGSDPQDLEAVATFLTFEEASLGRNLLRSAEIPAYLENELSPHWTGAGGLRLMVPRAFLEQAEEILEAQISDEELLAQAEAADPIEGESAPD